MLRIFLRQSLVLVCVALAPAFLCGLYHPKRPRFATEAITAGEIPLSMAKQLGAKALWIDARSKADYEAKHVPGALLLNEDDWDRLLEPVLDEWSNDRVIVVYCSSLRCQASHEVAARLRDEVGLSPVYVLKGGWETWEAGE